MDPKELPALDRDTHVVREALRDIDGLRHVSEILRDALDPPGLPLGWESVEVVEP